MSFEKGDIVECVDDANISNHVPKLNNGAKYVVADIHNNGVHVSTFYNENRRCMCGCGTCDKKVIYKSKRFRKIGTLYRTVEIASEIKELITEVFEVPDK